MAQRKPLNPNSTYGRKKLREQEQESYNQMSPDEKSKRDETVFIVLVIICILYLFPYL